MEGRLLARAREKLERVRLRNKEEEDRRRTEVYSRAPKLRETDASLRQLMGELLSLTGGGAKRSAGELEEESLSLQAKRAELLLRGGWPENYLEEIFSCPVCRDTGWVQGKGLCRCLIALYKVEQTRELSPLLKQGEETFENFRLDYYSAAAPAEGGIAPRRQMERVYNTCRQYAAGFGQNSPNLLFLGGPGLGKTFLSAAIAREVAAGGAGVAYDTATGLIASFEKEKFSRAEEDQAEGSSRVRQLLGCDLLILDDLGTEMSTAFTASALYALLDGRLRAGKKTIISANLDRNALETRYGPALFSRLNGEYQWLEFLGSDIRAVKKERK